MGIRTYRRLGKWRTPVTPYDGGEIAAWTSFIVPGMLARSNLDLLGYALKNLPPSGAIVEIGSFAGLSLNHILNMKQQYRRANPVFSVDAWTFEGADHDKAIPETNVPFAEYRSNVIETFKRNLMLFHRDSLPFHVTELSDEFFRLWEANTDVTDFFGRTVKLGGPIAMGYIDGNHTYEQSKRDFENVDRRLLRGGFVIFDDSADDSAWGSRIAAREASRRDNYELVEKNPNYCVRKVAE